MIKSILLLLLLGNNCIAQKNVTILFKNIANKNKIELDNTVYKNIFDENYTISKLKYYVSNIELVTLKKRNTKKSVYLINEKNENIITIKKPFGKIIGIAFLIGVDSALNCSGAQNGALDPLNDMFWTWNNGYTMFKLEGKSDSSKADNNRIEHHIGGYKGEYKTMQNIFLPLDENYFTKKNSITIIMNLDNYWTNNIKISENPIVATPGKMAKLVAENFVKLFSIQK